MEQRGDAVSSIVYEANARVRDPVYGCVGAISSLQQQIDMLQTQLAIAQAEVVHLKVRQAASLSTATTHHPISPSNSAAASPSPSSNFMPPSSHTKPFFEMDMAMAVDHDNLAECVWYPT